MTLRMYIRCREAAWSIDVAAALDSVGAFLRLGGLISTPAWGDSNNAFIADFHFCAIIRRDDLEFDGCGVTSRPATLLVGLVRGLLC